MCVIFPIHAVSGRIDIDAEWDNFQSNLKRAGLDEVIAEFQRLYNRLQ